MYDVGLNAANDHLAWSVWHRHSCHLMPCTLCSNPQRFIVVCRAFTSGECIKQQVQAPSVTLDAANDHLYRPVWHRHGCHLVPCTLRWARQQSAWRDVMACLRGCQTGRDKPAEPCVHREHRPMGL